MAIFFSNKAPWNLSDVNSGYLGCGGSVGAPLTIQGGTVSASLYDASSGWSDDISFTQNDTLTDLFISLANNATTFETIDRYALVHLVENVGTCTMTIANPCVVTMNSHGLSTGDGVMFTTTGALPTHILETKPRSTSVNMYFVNVQDQNTFWLYTNKASALLGGSTNRRISTGTQSGTHTLWASKRNWEVTPTQVIKNTTYPNNLGTYFVNLTLSSPYAITTGENKYKLVVAIPASDTGYGGTSAVGWYMQTGGTGSTPANLTLWAGCGSTVATPVSGTDFLIIRDTMTIDMDWTTKAHMQTGITTTIASGWCENKADWSSTGTPMIKWKNQPSASYTFIIDGSIYCSVGTIIEIGTQANPIPTDKPAKIYLTFSTGSTKNSGFRGSENGWARGPSIFLYGATPTIQTTTIIKETAKQSTVQYPGNNKISFTALPSWAVNGELIWIGSSASTQVSVPTGLTIGTLYI